jgi:hypothetical protein
MLSALLRRDLVLAELDHSRPRRLPAREPDRLKFCPEKSSTSSIVLIEPTKSDLARSRSIYTYSRPCLLANFVPFSVRVCNYASMGVDIEKQRARWRRNKRAERQRKAPGRVDVSAEFRATVFSERDRRAKLSREASYSIRLDSFYASGSWEKAISFAADVWAATVLIEAEWGDGKATPTRILRLLQSMGRTHGYTEQSLRKMIYKARERVHMLETRGHPWSPDEPFWPPVDVPDTTS